MQLPKEFDFKSTLNTAVDSYHAKEMPNGDYKVTCDFNTVDFSWSFTKEEIENHIINKQYIIIGDEHKMTNYICINGKKAELTEEQMKALGIEVPKANPFKRVKDKTKYWVIHATGVVDWHYDIDDSCDNDHFNTANYCTDKAILEQRALHETLSRLLWRYSMEHGGEGKVTIAYEPEKNRFTKQVVVYNYLEPSFKTVETAEDAIKEIIEPFMKAHPEFKF